MDSEMAKLKRYDVYDLVPHADGVRTLRLGWVLHWKFKNGTFEKSKARLVARGNHQRPVIDYNESFSPQCGWNRSDTPRPGCHSRSRHRAQEALINSI
jgi:hypothetical protein